MRSWPRKRGPNQTPAQKAQTDWFAAAKALSNRAPGRQVSIAMKAVKGTGLYPQDLFLRAIGVGLIDIITPDGKLIQYRQGEIEPVSFQGVILPLAAPIVVPPNTATVLTWTLPLIDTGGFWSVANPTRITVPAGVTVIELVARSFEAVNHNGQMMILIVKNGITEIGRAGYNATAFHGESWSSGAMVVTPGDYFEMSLFMTYAGNAPAGDLTQFGATILEAV